MGAEAAGEPSCACLPLSIVVRLFVIELLVVYRGRMHRVLATTSFLHLKSIISRRRGDLRHIETTNVSSDDAADDDDDWNGDQYARYHDKELVE